MNKKIKSNFNTSTFKTDNINQRYDSNQSLYDKNTIKQYNNMIPIKSKIGNRGPRSTEYYNSLIKQSWNKKLKSN